MTLQEFIRTHPPHERMEVRTRLGRACNVTEFAVRSWACGHKNTTPKLVKALCAATAWQVKPEDVRPDVFGPFTNHD